MADGTDELRDARTRASGDPSGPTPLSWPLVERRRADRTPPGGVDRRFLAPPEERSDVATLSAAPLWPFRLAALLGAALRAATTSSFDELPVVIATVAVTAYTIVALRRPIPYRNDHRVRSRILLEEALNTVAVLLTGAWASPFVLLLVPTGMLAGFAAGGAFSAIVSLAVVAVITVQHVVEVGVRTGLQDGALWAGLLGLVAFTSGLAHRAAHEAARQQQAALDRVSRLAEANSLLFALQRVAQTLPASLDLQEVLDSTVSRLRTMLRHDALVVYLVEPGTDRAVPVRMHGTSEAVPYRPHELPAGLRTAVESPKTVRLDSFRPGSGVTPTARSGLYSALRARGSLVGMVAVESNEPGAFGQQQAEVMHGLSEPFGIAIDNAHLFRRIRTMAADEERSRIARDLHDHVGSSLALIGFEIDRALGVAAEHGDVEPVLREVRDQVSTVVTEVRDTLYDLRTEVTDQRDLPATAAEFLARVQQRSGLLTHCDMRIPRRLPLMIERELWQIVREAILNAERHARARHLMVAARQVADHLTVTVRDDGVGLEPTGARPDSYGMVGMRERAHRLDADLTVRPIDGGGTEVRIELAIEGATP